MYSLRENLILEDTELEDVDPRPFFPQFAFCTPRCICPYLIFRATWLSALLILISPCSLLVRMRSVSGSFWVGSRLQV